MSPGLNDELARLEKLFTVDAAKLKQITERFGEELSEGLEKYGANISMNATWVHGFPTGRERGSYLTMDLGGTNLRVCWITLKERKGETEVIQDSYKLPNELKTGSADELFSFMADAIAKFVDEHDLREEAAESPLPLGFTFSYPANQNSIDHGALTTWTKGFDIGGVEGEDVAALLRDAMEKKDLPIRLVALVNDTTGAMIASAYNDPDTIIGAIFGTGCNAAYMEDVGSIPKLKTDLPSDTPMAINCEYGAFDNARNVLPLTKYDEAIDRDSPRPGEQAFEKMSAGLYLGEIFRLVLFDLHEEGVLLKGQDVSTLREPYCMDTGVLSGIENDSYSETKKHLADSYNISFTEEELHFAHELAALVAIRAARLCTCGIAAICKKKGIISGHVAADGSVANKHPTFKQRWAEALGEILDWPRDRREDPITITSAEDGSGIGAAVIAAMTLDKLKK